MHADLFKVIFPIFYDCQYKKKTLTMGATTNNELHVDGGRIFALMVFYTSFPFYLICKITTFEKKLFWPFDATPVVEIACEGKIYASILL